ncbi:MAG: hypothetical protein CM15mV2_1250 [uncultured marine virus]|nr:MAG: hypothetical protein CM15mV2_1250 [uncultured marine virus]
MIIYQGEIYCNCNHGALWNHKTFPFLSRVFDVTGAGDHAVFWLILLHDYIPRGENIDCNS